MAAAARVVDLYAYKTPVAGINEVAARGSSISVVHKGGHRHHQAQVFTLTWDEPAQEMISTGKDGMVVTWDAGGNVKQSMGMENYYSCGTDLNTNTQSLFLAGVKVADKQGGGVGPKIFMMRRGAGGGWEHCGAIPKDDIKIVTSVKCIGKNSGNTIVTGENLKDTPAFNVALYNIRERKLASTHTPQKHTDTSFALSPFSSRILSPSLPRTLPPTSDAFLSFPRAAPNANISTLKPTQNYMEHTDFITCLAAHQREQDMFFSGSKDNTVRYWDRRQAHR